MKTISRRLVSSPNPESQGMSNICTAPVDREEGDEGRARQSSSKYQAILSMDMETWQDIIDTLGLSEPMIEHRREAAEGGPGARGWYS